LGQMTHEVTERQDSRLSWGDFFVRET
jgi:hypothetical protein